MFVLVLCFMFSKNENIKNMLGSFIFNKLKCKKKKKKFYINFFFFFVLPKNKPNKQNYTLLNLAPMTSATIR